MATTWLLLAAVMFITEPVNMLLAPLPKEARLKFAKLIKHDSKPEQNEKLLGNLVQQSIFTIGSAATKSGNLETRYIRMLQCMKVEHGKTHLVAREGGEYSVEEHTARTSDGYVIGVHRVRMAARDQRHTVPVLLMHGIITTSEEFARMGRNRSIVYLLANEGFDVWLGNFRGNEYTSHVSLEKSDRAFWNYSVDEQGALDLPAIMETVRMGTGTEYIHYVGYSMGTTCYHVMCHARPDMAARVVSYTAMAPAADLSARLKNIAIDSKTGVLRTLRNIGLDVLGDTDMVVQRLVPSVCGLSNRDSEICLRLFKDVIGEDFDQVDWPMYSKMFSKLQRPSLRLIEHYMQLAITGTLSMFDYGKKVNLERYGQSDPPKYNLTANTAPVAIFVGKNDLLTPVENAMRLAKVLRKTCPVVYGKKVAYEKFNHVDFVWAKDVHKLLNYDVVKRIVKFSQKYDPVIDIRRK